MSLYAMFNDPIRLARASLEDGSAARMVESALAGQRLCARILDGTDTFPVGGGLADLPSVQALIAAGLIEPAPVGVEPVGEASSASGPRYRMSPAAMPFVKVDTSGNWRHVSLCYGRPKLEAVYLEGDGSLEPAPVLRFTYSLADRPPFADRPDMRAAFPFLEEFAAGPALAWNQIRFDAGTPDTRSLSIDPLMDLPSAAPEFAYCPPRGHPRTGICRTD